MTSKINHKGKRGDTIHIPKPTRGAANAKTVGSQVTLNENNSSEVTVSLDKHYEYSVVIEDIIATQSLSSLRRFHTDDAGYALAKQIDTDLVNLWEGFQGGTVGAGWANAVIGGDGTTAYDDAANTNAGNGSAITDAGIRKVIQTLDDADVPMSDRYLVIPPVMRNTMMGLARFTEQAYTGEVAGGNTIRNGQIGDVYGVKVFVSSNVPTETADDTSTQYRAACMFHKDALVLAEQQGVRAQTQYKQEYLGNLYTSDCIYGVAELRDDAGVAIIVPA